MSEVAYASATPDELASVPSANSVASWARWSVTVDAVPRRGSPSASLACEHRNEFALPAARRALPARQLHRMRGVEYDRTARFTHDHQRTHV